MHTLVKQFGEYLKQERMLLPRTVQDYVKVIERFEQFLVNQNRNGKVNLETATKNQLVDFLKHETNRDCQPSRSSWNSRLAALRAFYEFLFRQEKISANPALKIERLKVKPREPCPPTLEEVIRLVETIRYYAPSAYCNRNIAIVQVLFHCALRLNELVSLNVSQLDFDNYVFLNVRVKGGKQISVCFNDVVAEALENWLHDRERIFQCKNADPALFLSDRHTRIKPRTIQDMIARYARLAGIAKQVSPHLLRHSNATQLVEMGASLRVVQEICGHASVTTTQRYVHVSSGRRRQAIDALGRQWRKCEQERRTRKQEEQ